MAALRAVAILVLFPSTLASAFFTLMGLAFSADSIRRGEQTSTGIFLLCAMFAGWFGLVTAWRVYYGILLERSNLNRPVTWVGLASGSLTSIALVYLSGGSFLFRIMFFGWPLIAVVYFAFAIRSR